MTTNGIHGGANLDLVNTRNQTQGKNSSQSKASTVHDEAIRDTVDISDEARTLLEQSVADKKAFQAKTESGMTRDIQFNEEDLEAVKSRFKALKKNKAQLQVDIDRILKENGLNTFGGEKLKIEIDSKGKIIVGGISDPKKAKAIEAALNKEPNLAKRIKDIREEETAVSGELEEVTGQSLKGLRDRLSDIQNDTLENGIPVKSSIGESYSKEEMMEFKDQDLYRIDPELIKEINEYFSLDSQYDVAPGNDILSDPAAAMNSMAKKIRDQIEKGFKSENDRLRDNFEPKNDEDAKLLDTMLLSLQGVKIDIDANGNVTIDGKVAEDGRSNEKGIKLIEKYVQAMMKDNPVTGDKNGFKVAAERLVNLYEDEYGEEAGDGNAVTTIADGKVETRLSSPKKEAELKEDIQADLNKAVEKMGVPLKEKLDIAIGDDGKIRVANMIADPKQQQAVQDLLGKLTGILMSSDSGTANDDNTMDGILNRIKDKIRQLSVFKPNGVSELQKAYSAQ